MRKEKSRGIITGRNAAYPQHFVDNGTRILRKKLSHVKYSSEGSGFLRFYSYLYQVVADFCLSLNERCIKTNGKSDMANKLNNFCSSGTYKGNESKVLQNLGIMHKLWLRSGF